MKAVRVVVIGSMVGLLGGVLAAGQVTQITAAKIVDGAGKMLAHGQIDMLPVTQSGTPIQPQLGGGGVVLYKAASCLIVNGAITTAVDGSTCTTADTSLSNQKYFCYKAVVKDTSVTPSRLFPPMPCLQPQGTTWSLDSNYAPGIPANQQIAQGPIGPAGPAGAGFISGLASDGASGITVTAKVAAATVQANTLQGSQFRGLGLTLLGDSITAGVQAFGTTCLTGGQNCWADQLVAYYGFAGSPHANNIAVSGSNAVDVSHQAFNVDTAIGQGSQVVTLLDGQNDGCSAWPATNNGTRTEPGWLGIMESLAYHEMLTRKMNASAMTSTGTWSSSSYYTGGLSTIANGATLTFTSLGPTVLVSIMSAGTFAVGTAPSVTVQVDSGSPQTFLITGQVSGTYNYPNSGWLIRIPGQTSTTHSVKLTAVIQNTSFPLYVNWGAGNMGQGGKQTQRTLFWGYPYATSDETEAGGLSVCRANIDMGLSDLQADGLNAQLVDLTAQCYSSSFTAMCAANDPHPDTAGATIIFNAFKEAMDRVAYPRPAQQIDKSQLLPSTNPAVNVSLTMNAQGATPGTPAGAAGLNYLSWNGSTNDLWEWDFGSTGTNANFSAFHSGASTNYFFDPLANYINEASCTATSLVNCPSQAQYFNANYWDGSASTLDQWQCSTNGGYAGGTASLMSCFHAGGRPAYLNWGNVTFQLPTSASSVQFLNLSGFVPIIISSSTGKALCEKTDHSAGHCSTVVDSSGNCTCI